MSESVQPILVLISSMAGANPMQFMIERAFAHHVIDWRYLTVEVAAERLGDALRGIDAMGFRGGHLADPHKQTALPLLSQSTPAAASIGVANVLFREGDDLVGDNTEGKGALAALRAVRDPAGQAVLLLGAGRMARAVAYELAAAGAAEIRVVDRSEAHAQALADMLTGQFTVPVTAAVWQGDCVIPAETQIVVHATSLGHEGDATQPGVALESLRPELIVADVTFDTPQTWLLSEAAARGCATVDGLTMFIEQVALALRRWTGVEVDRQVLRDAVEEYLEL